MTEDSETARDIKDIKHRVKSLDQFQVFQLKAQKDKILDEVLEDFGNSERKARVYLEVDGKKSVSDIASSLEMDQGNVSKLLKDLIGVIEVKEVTNRGEKIYKKRKQAKILDLSSKLNSAFDL